MRILWWSSDLICILLLSSFVCAVEIALVNRHRAVTVLAAESLLIVQALSCKALQRSFSNSRIEYRDIDILYLDRCDSEIRLTWLSLDPLHCFALRTRITPSITRHQSASSYRLFTQHAARSIQSGYQRQSTISLTFALLSFRSPVLCMYALN